MNCLKKLSWVSVLRRLKPEDKVNIAIAMTDLCVSVCAEGIRVEHPGISDKELLEKLRERLDYAKRMRRRQQRRKV